MKTSNWKFRMRSLFTIPAKYLRSYKKRYVPLYVFKFLKKYENRKILLENFRTIWFRHNKRFKLFERNEIVLLNCFF